MTKTYRAARAAPALVCALFAFLPACSGTVSAPELEPWRPIAAPLGAPDAGLWPSLPEAAAVAEPAPDAAAPAVACQPEPEAVAPPVGEEPSEELVEEPSAEEPEPVESTPEAVADAGAPAPTPPPEPLEPRRDGELCDVAEQCPHARCEVVHFGQSSYRVCCDNATDWRPCFS